MARLQAFGPYDLIERVSVGSTGEVFRAVRRGEGRVVALKRLMPSASRDRRLVASHEREAVIARALDHPSIVKVLDSGVVEGCPFIAYEFVIGRDLYAVQGRVQAQQPALIPLDIAVYIVMRLAEALEHAHTRLSSTGVPLAFVHRDVSPSNVLLAFDGRVLLSDFGVARSTLGSEGTGVGEVKGTLGYLSPEQIGDGPIDARTDVYALGVLLHELATGQRLFEGQAHEVMPRIHRGEFPLPRARNSRIGIELERIIVKALAKEPKLRYPACGPFLEDLSELVRSEGLNTEQARVARFVRSLFPEAAAECAVHREESLNMADEKGGSDLDVFEGLAKKTAKPTLPGLVPPLTVQQRQRTMVGGLNPPAPPPPKPSLPPPSLGKPLPPPSSVATFAPPPSSATPPPLPPTHAASSAPSASSLPPVSLPPVSLPRVTAPVAASIPAPSISLDETVSLTKSESRALAPKPSVDMDWDDDEESTHVYDKLIDGVPDMGPRPAAGTPPPNTKVAAAAGLLAKSGGAATAVPRSAPPPALAVPPPPKVPAPLPQRDQPTAVNPRVAIANLPNQSIAPPPAQSRLVPVLGGLVVAAVAIGAFVLWPRSGDLKIEISTPDGSSVDRADIYVDGQKKCETTPCIVRGLSTGPKTVKALVPGLPTVESIATVESGREQSVALRLAGAAPNNPSVPTVPGSASGTGLKIASSQSNVRVLVDGVDKGTLPIELKDLTPGAHKLRLEAGDAFAPIERTVDVTSGSVLDLGSMSLKVIKGKVTVELATSGADVKLVHEQGGRQVEERKVSPPLTTELDASGWKVVATKKGYEDFTQAVSFDDGSAEKKIVVSLSESAKPTGGTAAAANTGASTPKTSTDTGAAAPSGKATLNMNSIPVSKVVLDGRPLGSTPKMGVSVSPGSHTVTFISADKGNKSVTVTVKAGETKTAAVRF